MDGLDFLAGLSPEERQQVRDSILASVDFVAGIDFDGPLAHYARTDRAGQITVHRVADDAEICRLPAAIPNAFLRMSPDGRYLATRSAPVDDVQVWLTSASPAQLVLSETCKATYGMGAIDFDRDSEHAD